MKHGGRAYRTWNSNDVFPLSEIPREGKLGRRNALLFGDGLELADELEVLGEVLL